MPVKTSSHKLHKNNLDRVYLLTITVVKEGFLCGSSLRAVQLATFPSIREVLGIEHLSSLSKKGMF